MATAAAALLVLWAHAEPAAAARKSHPGLWGDPFGEAAPKLRRTVVPAKVPLPKPRPSEAPIVEPTEPAAETPAPAAIDKPAKGAAPEAPQPSACRAALTADIAIAPSIPDIHGAGGCGGEDLVRLEAVVLSDRKHVLLQPPATLRCTMAFAIANWVRTDIAPVAAGLGSEPVALDNFDSYECRSFNGIAGAHLSEHARANALDVRGFRLANGQSISLTDRNVPRELRESVLHSACARFSTVLGPGSDWYHEEHIHLDLMERHNNYRICQWNVWDPLPQVAPLLPAVRPDDAPPREVAAKPDAAKPDAAKPGDVKPDDVKPRDAKPDASKPDSAKPASSETAPPTKKRRQSRRF
jgi:hypothetical protein